MKVHGDRHQHHHAHKPQEQKGGQQGEMAKMWDARGRNDLGLREGLKQIGRLFGASGGIPGLRSETFTPRTKTCPWGPRTWGTHIFWCDRKILFRLVRRVFEIVHGSTVFFLRVADFFGEVFFAVERVAGSSAKTCAIDGASGVTAESATAESSSSPVGARRPLLEV